MTLNGAISINGLVRANCVLYVDCRGEGTETPVTNSNVLAAARLLRRGGPTYEQEAGIETAPRQHA